MTSISTTFPRKDLNKNKNLYGIINSDGQKIICMVRLLHTT